MKTIYVKNMVCNRCILAVKQELQRLQIPFISVSLSEIQLEDDISSDKKEELKSSLEQVGFGFVEDKKAQTVERMKGLLVDLIQNDGNNLRINYSVYLSEKLKMDYNYLSGLFSSIENTTIEKFTIALKIERVKELLVYHELSLSEIAFQLNYSSVQALSSQFKKVTGLTPSHFKMLKHSKPSSAQIRY